MLCGCASALAGAIALVVFATPVRARATDVGLNLSYGKGTDLSPNNLNFSDLKPTSSSQFLVYLFLASAYEF